MASDSSFDPAGDNEGPKWCVQARNCGARDTVYAGFELGTLSAEDRRAFLEEVLEYFQLKDPDTE